jgi:RND family efflux transporter MFP subunit
MCNKHLLCTVFSCFLLSATACTETPSEESRPPQALPVARVQLLTISEQPARRQNEVPGTVEAVQRTTIAAKITGTIEKLPVELGSLVKSGALLVRISAAEIDARLAQAQAQLDQAHRNLEREKRLLAKEAATPQIVKSMEDVYLLAKAGFAEARTMLGYTTITAPFSGVIAMKHAQAGDLATPGRPLLLLENIDKLQIVAQVPETLARPIRLGDRLPVRLASRNLELEGVVAEIAPSADPLSRTTTVKLRIADAESSLRPGQYALVVLPGPAVNTLLAPATAVSRYGQMERVFVVHDNIARLRLVRTGERYGNRIEILTGLNGGEQVVIVGADHLLDGQPVEIMP